MCVPATVIPGKKQGSWSRLDSLLYSRKSALYTNFSIPTSGIPIFLDIQWYQPGFLVARFLVVRGAHHALLTLLGPQSRFGDKLLIIRVFCPHIWECGSKGVNTSIETAAIVTITGGHS